MIFFNSSYGFTLTISSPIHGANVYASYNLVLSCPRVFINNMTNPIIHQWGYETPLFFTTETVLSCYFLPTAVAIKSTIWGHNNTGSKPYTESNILPGIWGVFTPLTNINITFSQYSLIPANSTLKVSYSVTFSNDQVSTDSRIIQFLQKTVIVNIASVDLTGTIYIPYGDDLIIDASQT